MIDNFQSKRNVHDHSILINHFLTFRAVGSPLLMDPNRICRKSRKVGNKQREICRDEPEIVEEAVAGAKLAIEECGAQFRDRKWNCSTRHRGIRKVLKLGKSEEHELNNFNIYIFFFKIEDMVLSGHG